MFADASLDHDVGSLPKLPNNLKELHKLGMFE